MDLPTQLALKAADALRSTRSETDDRYLLIRPLDNVQAATIIDRETQLPQWKAALEGLTPSGSEFVDDPEACRRFVRERLDNNHRMLMEALRKLRDLSGESE